MIRKAIRSHIMTLWRWSFHLNGLFVQYIAIHLYTYVISILLVFLELNVCYELGIEYSNQSSFTILIYDWYYGL